MTEAAAPAPAPAASAAPQSTHERIKAFLGSQSGPPAEAAKSASEADETGNPKAPSGQVAPVQKAPAAEAPAPNEQVEGDDAPAPETDPEEPAAPDGTDADDAPFDPAKLSSLKELADAAGLEHEKMLDLELPVKIDGKEGKARLRDLVKSYQLDGHINQKLASFDNDRKAFETKKQEAERAANERLLRLDAGVKTLERALMGEFSAVDWQKLQTEDPVRFNSEYVAYQQRFAVMQDIARQIATEQQQYQQAEEAKAKERFAEEFKLLQAKVPEWSDTTKRNKDKAEIVEALKDYGISREEFEAITDHRQLLVVRDAWKWRQLQKSKPATLNKVKAAPKLLKPGTTQSRAAQNALALQKDSARLKQTGRVRDAAPAIKRILFGG